MPARNWALFETVPSISTAIKVLPSIISSALVSLSSMAWPQAVSRARTRPPSSLAVFWPDAEIAVAMSNAIAIANVFFIVFMMHLCRGGRLPAQSRAVRRLWEKKSGGTFAICNWKKKAAEWRPLVWLIALTESKRPIWRSAFPATLRHRDFGAEVHVLDCVEEFYTFGH